MAHVSVDLMRFWVVGLVSAIMWVVESMLLNRARGANPQDRQLRLQVLETKREIKRHDSVAFFVKKAKLERSLIALEKQLQSATDETATLVAAAEKQAGYIRMGLHGIAVALLALGPPLMTVPSGHVWPFGWALGLHEDARGLASSLVLLSCGTELSRRVRSFGKKGS